MEAQVFNANGMDRFLRSFFTGPKQKCFKLYEYNMFFVENMRTVTLDISSDFPIICLKRFYVFLEMIL